MLNGLLFLLIVLLILFMRFLILKNKTLTNKINKYTLLAGISLVITIILLIFTIINFNHKVILNTNPSPIAVKYAEKLPFIFTNQKSRLMGIEILAKISS